MSVEEYPLVALAETTKEYVKTEKNDEVENRGRPQKTTKTKEKKSLLRRLPSFQTTLRPKFGSLRHSIRKINCFKNVEEDEDNLPMMDVPRHKSFDISVGLARRMSQFIFTRKTVNAHPYHPYTPSQSTRKIHWFSEEKH